MKYSKGDRIRITSNWSEKIDPPVVVETTVIAYDHEQSGYERGLLMVETVPGLDEVVPWVSTKSFWAPDSRWSILRGDHVGPVSLISRTWDWDTHLTGYGPVSVPVKIEKV